MNHSLQLNSSRRGIVTALIIVFSLTALDQTVVTTAMPRIIAELGGLDLYAWVATSYLLASTIAALIAGKLGDVIGRRRVLHGSIVIFAVGSGLCGIADEFGALPLLGNGMMQLIAFRAVQGIGGGALMAITFVVIGDLYQPRERARMSGLFAAIFGLSSAIGPLIGGFLTDYGDTTLFGHAFAGWRWIFYVNLPLSVVSLVMVSARMPVIALSAKRLVDYRGLILVVITVVPLLLAFTYGGRTLPWGSVPILSMLAISAAGLVLYVMTERLAEDPILPLNLFAVRAFSALTAMTFIMAIAFISAVTFLPLLIQIGRETGATAAGLTMLPLIVGAVIGAVGSGSFVAKTGAYKGVLVVGSGLTFVGIALLSQVSIETSTLDIVWRIFLLGLGQGPAQGIANYVIQIAVPDHCRGVATGALQFFRQIGMVIGLAVFGGIFSSGIDAQSHALGFPRDIAQGSAAVSLPLAVRQDIVDAIDTTLTYSLLAVALGIVATLCIPRLPPQPDVPDSPYVHDDVESSANATS